MPRKSSLTPDHIETIRTSRARGESLQQIATALGVSRSAVQRGVKALSVRKTAADYPGAKSVGVRAPRRPQVSTSWSIERIRAARDAQMRGDFELPVRLAEAMRTDDALFVAYHARVAPQSAVTARIVPYPSVRGERIATKARESITIPRSVLKGIVGTFANHEIAIGYVRHEPNEDGTVINMTLEEWPLEFVKEDPSTGLLMTRTAEDPARVPITHGDGQWIIFRDFRDRPWTQGGAVLPGGMIWAAHAGGIKDWAATSASHGQAKVIGTLPEGISLRGPESSEELSPEAEAFLTLLQDIVSGESGAGLQPFGSEVDFLANGSTAWQVFNELVTNRERAAARIYLGTDAILGAQGGAPGIDISALFGIASTKIQGDLGVLIQGLNTGLLQPWTAINEGDTHLAPSIEYDVPDPDVDKKSEEEAKKLDRLLLAIKSMRDLQLTVDQAAVNALAKKFGVSPVPQLPAVEAATVPLEFAPTQLNSFVLVREARAAKSLPPFGDERDLLTIAELDARTATAAAAERAAADAKAQIAVDDNTAEAPAL